MVSKDTAKGIGLALCACCVGIWVIGVLTSIDIPEFFLSQRDYFDYPECQDLIDILNLDGLGQIIFHSIMVFTAFTALCCHFWYEDEHITWKKKSYIFFWGSFAFVVLAHWIFLIVILVMLDETGRNIAPNADRQERFISLQLPCPENIADLAKTVYVFRILQAMLAGFV